jgi:hypothetical protein
VVGSFRIFNFPVNGGQQRLISVNLRQPPTEPRSATEASSRPRAILPPPSEKSGGKILHYPSSYDALQHTVFLAKKLVC